MATTSSITRTLQVALRPVVLSPLCADDVHVIMARITSQCATDRKLRSVLGKHSNKDIKRVARDLVHEAHQPVTTATTDVSSDESPTFTHATQQMEAIDMQARSRALPLGESHDDDLPDNVQHEILSKLRIQLEQACFELSTRYAPDLLSRNSWTSSTALELQLWVHAAKSNEAIAEKLRQICPKDKMAKMLTTLAEIRHSAVHKERRSQLWIKHALECAKLFLGCFDRPDHIAIIASLENFCTKAIEHNADLKHQESAIVAQFNQDRIEIEQRYHVELQELRCQQSLAIETLYLQHIQMLQSSPTAFEHAWSALLLHLQQAFQGGRSLVTSFHAECYRWMVEGTPSHEV